MKHQQIVQQIQLLHNHRSIQNIQSISTFQYHLTFFLHDALNVYSNSKWQMAVIFSQDYPYSAPKLKFLTNIFHLNIDKNGWVRMGMLEQQWTQMSSIYNVFDELQNLLQYPDTNHAVDNNVLDLYLNKRSSYQEKCFTQLQQNKSKFSRVDSEGKAEIQQELQDLSKMKLTQFDSLDLDFKTSLPINMKSTQSKIQIPPDLNESCIYGKKHNMENFINLQNFLKPPQTKSNQKKGNLLKRTKNQFENEQILSKNLSTDNQTRDIKTFKIMKQSKLNSIAQSVKGQEASNIFDLSVSKDQKGMFNMKNSKTQGFENQNQQLIRTLEIKRGKSCNEIKTLSNSLLKQKLSYISNQQNNQQKQYTEQKAIRPDLLYKKIVSQNCLSSQKLLYTISNQIWTRIQQIAGIQKSMISVYVSKSQNLQKTLKKKLNDQIKSLQRLEKLQVQIKSKVLRDMKANIKNEK